MHWYMKSCYFCGNKFSSFSIELYLKHMARHRCIHNFKFKCGYLSCPTTYKSYSALYTHCKRHHFAYRKRTNIVLLTEADIGTSSVLPTPNCTVPSCQRTCKDRKHLVNHMKSHIRMNCEIQCPFRNCSSRYSKVSSFSSHLSRCHRDVSHDEQLCSTGSVNIQELQKIEELDCSANDSFTSVSQTRSAANSGNDTIEMTRDIINPFAMLLLKLESKLLVPQSTIQILVEELMHITESTDEHLKTVLTKKLDLPETHCSSLKRVFENESLSSLLNNKHLNTIHKRRNYYETNFHYVAPIEIFLGEINSIKCCCHYIPIKTQLSTYLQLFKEVLFERPKSKVNILSDFWDGNLYQHLQATTSLNFFLYQDSFEIVNPIGSSKKKHKLLAVYCMIGNIPAAHRMSLANILLVMLVKEKHVKHFGQSAVFRRLLADLKDLISNGINFDLSHSLKCNLLGIMGDNLGAHFVGGFVENFTTENFCRFCDISKTSFSEEPYRCGEKRTERSYDQAIDVLNNDKTLHHHLGIKFPSLFHQLPDFHVCKPSLPPCIGHDLFEGVVAYDLALFIKHFVKLKWFTYDILNKRIQNFDYSAHDRSDQPPIIATNAKKLAGQAAENWCLLRLFSLIIFDRVKNSNDKIWKLFLSLREVVELVCAYEISHSQLAYLNVLCKDYVDRRKKHFPSVRLRPKHHFLLHYPALTMQFGPLIRLWTLRMESKHSYFKRCTRATKSFKNITWTLANKHQLFQAYRCKGMCLNLQVELSAAQALQPSSCSPSIFQELQKLNLLHNSVTTTSAIYQGITYKCRMIVAASEASQIEFCQIKGIILNNDVLYFLVQKCTSAYLAQYGMYRLVVCEDHLKCLKVTGLLDFYPLPCYTINGKNYIVLKHSLLPPCADD